MPKRKRSRVTSAVSHRMHRERQKRFIQKKVKTWTEQDQRDLAKKKQDRREKIRELDPQGYREAEASYKRKWRQSTKSKTVVVNEKKPKGSGITFTAVNNGERRVQYKQDDIYYDYPVVMIPKSVVPNNIKPITEKSVLRNYTPETILFSEAAIEVWFEDILSIVTYEGIPSVIIDAYLTLLLKEEKFIPVKFFPYFTNPEMRVEPKWKLFPKFVMAQDRIFVPLNIFAGKGHFFLGVMFPKENTFCCYDSAEGFVNKKDKERHVNEFLDHLHKAVKLDREKYEIQHKPSPQQTENKSCGIHMLYVVNCLIKNKKKIPKPEESELETLRREVFINILTETPSGKLVLRHFVE